jgi:hypothetical protein
MENKATELNAGIRRTIEQLAQETDAARQSQLFRDYLMPASWVDSTLGLSVADSFAKGKRESLSWLPCFSRTRSKRKMARKRRAYSSRSFTSSTSPRLTGRHCPSCLPDQSENEVNTC